MRDLETASHWYQRLLGQAPSFPMQEVAEFPFHGGGWLQVFADAGRAGKSSITLSVTDIEVEVQRLHGLGIQVGEVQSGDHVKIAMMEDLDGNRIVLAEPLVQGMAQ